MFRIKVTRKFEKDIILCFRRNYEMENLTKILNQLETNGVVNAQHKPHKLKGNYKGYWECHIKPDWLLIWKTTPKINEITLVRCGTHSDLFS